MQCAWCKSTDMVDSQKIDGFIDVHIDGKMIEVKDEQQLCNKCYTNIMYCHCCKKDTQPYNDMYMYNMSI